MKLYNKLFNQPAMRNMPKGVREARKCEKAAKYDTLHTTM
jgi:hypothetical protein